jgi:hypothetical protein
LSAQFSIPSFWLTALKRRVFEDFEQFIEGFAGPRNFGIGKRS